MSRSDDDDREMADADAQLHTAAAAPDGGLTPHHQEDNAAALQEDNSYAVFQTPSESHRNVVTPPPIEKRHNFRSEENDHQDENVAPEICGSDNSVNRKRTRAAAASATTTSSAPPMFPRSPEFIPGAVAAESSSVFRRHLPIHSPIAGLASTVNVAFLAQLVDGKSEEESFPTSSEDTTTLSSRVMALSRRDSFLARHSFPILEDDELKMSAAAAAAAESSVLSCTRVLKMRRRCPDEVLDGLLQAERELLS